MSVPGTTSTMLAAARMLNTWIALGSGVDRGDPELWSTMQIPAPHTPVEQSEPVLQRSPALQAPQVAPPQSTSDSEPFRTPSVHLLVLVLSTMMQPPPSNRARIAIRSVRMGASVGLWMSVTP